MRTPYILSLLIPIGLTYYSDTWINLHDRAVVGNVSWESGNIPNFTNWMSGNTTFLCKPLTPLMRQDVQVENIDISGLPLN